MAFSVTITLTTAGSNVGPFDLYSDVDSYAVPFETNITRLQLIGGYYCFNTVPDGTTTIQVKSTDICTNSVFLSVTGIPDPSPTPSVTPTISNTPTISVTPTLTTTPPGTVSITPSVTTTISVTPTLTPTRTVTPTLSPIITHVMTIRASTNGSIGATSIRVIYRINGGAWSGTTTTVSTIPSSPSFVVDLTVVDGDDLDVGIQNDSNVNREAGFSFTIPAGTTGVCGTSSPYSITNITASDTIYLNANVSGGSLVPC